MRKSGVKKKKLKVIIIVLSGLIVIYGLICFYFAEKARWIVNSTFESYGKLTEELEPIMNERFAFRMNYRRSSYIDESGYLKDGCYEVHSNGPYFAFFYFTGADVYYTYTYVVRRKDTDERCSGSWDIHCNVKFEFDFSKWKWVVSYFYEKP